MGPLIHQTAFYIHVIAGSIALVVFWLPMLASKGGTIHRQYGHYFSIAMYTVALSGLTMTSLVLLDPIGIRAPERNLTFEAATQLATKSRNSAAFLFMLSLLVLVSVRQGLLVLKSKHNRKLLRQPFHLALLLLLVIAGVFVGLRGFELNIVLFQIFAVICILVGSGHLHYIFKPVIKPREWLIAHLSAIIGAGIGAYTAFFVFGSSRLFSQFVDGGTQVSLWIIPGLIGTVGSAYLTRKYRRTYRVA
ncbi:hypothetical protein [Aliikangiella sp. G2MR2-5]|uniref:hypothetical protein n=1 Tax=Aliikangiella sp. G2MR2-5 TaxID=2788943 RepID=UPI0018AB8F5A|nr:hypothetical protein [Aliikangiella sp. G2MR2-5]